MFLCVASRVEVLLKIWVTEQKYDTYLLSACVGSLATQNCIFTAKSHKLILSCIVLKSYSRKPFIEVHRIELQNKITLYGVG